MSLAEKNDIAVDEVYIEEWFELPEVPTPPPFVGPAIGAIIREQRNFELLQDDPAYQARMQARRDAQQRLHEQAQADFDKFLDSL